MKSLNCVLRTEVINKRGQCLF